MRLKLNMFLAVLLLACWMTLSCRAQTVLMTGDAWKEDTRLDQKATLVYQGGPRNEMLARLTKEYGVELSAASNTKEDLIVLMVTEQPLSVILPKIAKHFNFEWERTGEKPAYRYRLYQTVKAAEEEKAEREAQKASSEQLKAIRKRIDLMTSKMDTPRGTAYTEIEKLLKQAEGEKDWTKRLKITARMTEYQGVFDPKCYLALSLAKSFTPLDWQKTQSEEGLTYSTHPWGTERPLPPALLALAQKETDRQITLARQDYERSLETPYQPAMQPAPDSEETEEGDAEDASPADSESVVSPPSDFEDAPPLKMPEFQKLGGFKIRFSEEKYSPLSIKGAMFDEKGEHLPGVYFYVWLSEEAQPDAEWFSDRPELKERFAKAFNYDEGSYSASDVWGEEEKNPQKEALKKDPSTDPILATKIKLPDEVLKSLAWMSAFGSGSEDGEARQQAMMAVFNEFQELLSKADKQEPLEWSYSPVLKNVHEQAKLNIISDGFDLYALANMFFGTNEVSQLSKAQNLAEILNAFLDAPGLDSEIDQGWLALRSLKYSLLRASQTPRPILRKWSKRLTSKKKLSLDELGALAVDLDGREIDGSFDLMTYLFWATGMESIRFSAQDMSLLRFYATLTPGQKSAASSEKGLLPSEMSSQQQTQYRKLLFSGPYLEATLTSLTDPLLKIDPSKFALTLERKQYAGYSGRVEMEGQQNSGFGNYSWEMTEEEYRATQKGMEEWKNSPEAAGYKYVFDKGSILEETLTVAAETPLTRMVAVKTFEEAPKEAPKK